MYVTLHFIGDDDDGGREFKRGFNELIQLSEEMGGDEHINMRKVVLNVPFSSQLCTVIESMYIYMYVCMYVYSMYACMYVCMLYAQKEYIYT